MLECGGRDMRKKRTSRRHMSRYWFAPFFLCLGPSRLGQRWPNTLLCPCKLVHNLINPRKGHSFVILSPSTARVASRVPLDHTVQAYVRGTTTYGIKTRSAIDAQQYNAHNHEEQLMRKAAANLEGIPDTNYVVALRSHVLVAAVE